MNRMQRARMERAALQYLKFNSKSGNYDGRPALNTHNTWQHEQVKCMIMYELKKRGHTVYAEGEFITGGFGDIIDISKGVIYEVIKSETKEACLEKVKKYPDFFEVIIIDANKPFEPTELF